MDSYHIQSPDGFREVGEAEWAEAEQRGCETYCMKSVEGRAFVAVDPSRSFSFEGVKNWMQRKS